MEDIRTIYYYLKKEREKEKKDNDLIKLLEADIEYKLRKPNIKLNNMTKIKTINTDVFIVTALHEEFEMLKNEVDKVAKPLSDIPEYNYDISYYKYSYPINSRNVNLLISYLNSPDVVDAAMDISTFLNNYESKLLILVGIAGSLKKEDLKLGDVIVGEEIIWYDVHAKTTDTDRFFTPRGFEINTEMVRKFKDAVLDSHFKNNFTFENFNPKVTFGKIACGNDVVDSTEFREKVKGLNRKAEAIETESGGALRAANRREEKVKIIVVRGISDYAMDKGETDIVWRSNGMLSAITAIFEFIRFLTTLKDI